MTPIEGYKIKHEFYPKGMYFIPFAVPQWANSVKQVDKTPKLLMVARLQKRKNVCNDDWVFKIGENIRR